MTKRRKTSDGRIVTQPELRIVDGSLSPDTTFTVSGTSPWNSASKYNVVLNGPNSYYTYKTSQLETDENGDEIRSWVTKTGNDPQRLARYRSYVKEGERANDYTSLWEDFLRSIGLKKKDGGWLTKFENGGQTTQAVSPEQDVMDTIDAAIGEIQTKRPGQAVQKLAAMMQDPNYSMIIDMIKQEYPQIEGVLNTVEQMIGSFKCGGKTKKKVKKGAKGCVPCKKLMKVGGKLINVWSDCEGNIISKHQAGGWLIPKGDDGLVARRRTLLDKSHNATWLGQQQGYTRTAAGPQYYKDDATGKIYTRSAIQNSDGSYTWDPKGWAEVGAGSVPSNVTFGTKDELERQQAYVDTYGVEHQYYDGTGWKHTKSYYDPTTKAVKWEIVRDATDEDFGADDIVAGANWEKGIISEADAAAAGIEVSPFRTVLGTRGKYEASYNPMLGESKPSEVDITQGYINSLGGMNAAVKHERQQRRKDRRAQRAEHRAYNSSARLSTKDTNTSNDVNVLTTDEKQANLNNINTNYANQASRMAAAMKAKWANYNVGTPASGAVSNSRTDSNRDVLKQGGWLTKFN